jgi:enamine deaminase RidA (YjgF/YER057c/UK114 family)
MVKDGDALARATSIGPRAATGISADAAGGIPRYASLNETGKPAEFSMMEQQMRATYANAVKLLACFGATLDNVVEETLYVLDVDAALPRARCGRRHTARRDPNALAT